MDGAVYGLWGDVNMYVKKINFIIITEFVCELEHRVRFKLNEAIPVRRKCVSNSSHPKIAYKTNLT